MARRGRRQALQVRNIEIVTLYRQGTTLQELMDKYNMSYQHLITLTKGVRRKLNMVTRIEKKEEI